MEKTIEDKLIKITTVMEYVQMSKAKIYELMKKGEFPKNHLIGGSSLWFLSDIQDYISGHKKQKNERVA